MRSSLLAPLLALVTASSSSGQTFLVDDDGPADFASIDAAIASPLVLPGSTLLVADGTYPGFTLTKQLHILPVAGQGYSVSGAVLIDQAPSFSLVGAQLSWLTIRNVPGRGLVDRCSVEHETSHGVCFYQDGFTRIEGCAELLLQRSQFRGWDANYGYGHSIADHGATIESSTVTITDCHFWGGWSFGIGPDCVPHYPTIGQGLDISKGSVVLLAGTTAETGIDPVGWEVPAVGVEDSVLVVRGNSGDLLHTYADPTASPITMDATSIVFVSGVQLQPAILPAGVVSPSPAEPFLRITGGEAPGTPLVVELFGPAGSLALIGVSSVPALQQLPGVYELLLLSPSGLFATWPVTTAGQELAAGFAIGLPWDPLLAGVTFTAQAWVDPAGGSGPWLTNAFELVLGG